MAHGFGSLKWGRHSGVGLFIEAGMCAGAIRKPEMDLRSRLFKGPLLITALPARPYLHEVHCLPK